jgi:hypothetical protein
MDPSKPQLNASPRRPDPRPRTFLGVYLALKSSYPDEKGLPDDIRNYLRVAARAGSLNDDARSELIDHFLCGLADGRSSEDLIQRLGHPRALGAKLGRVSSPMRWVLGRAFPWAMYGIAGLILTYIALWACLRWTKPEPTVDYFAVANQITLTTPEQTHAWPIYRDAFSDPRMHANTLYDAVGRYDPPYLYSYLDSAQPGDERWPVTVAFMKEIQPLIQKVKEGTRKPHLGYTLMVWDQTPERDQRATAADMAEPLYPTATACAHPVCRLAEGQFVELELRPLRRLSNYLIALLVADMHQAADQGDALRVLDDWQCVRSLTRQFSELPLWIARGKSGYVLVTGAGAMSQIALAYPGLLSQEQIADIRLQLLSDMAALGDLPPLPDLEYQDRLQRAYSPGPDGRITRLGLVYLYHCMTSNNVTVKTDPPSWESNAWAEAMLPIAYFYFPGRRELDEDRSKALASYRLDGRTLWAREFPKNPLYKQRYEYFGSVENDMRQTLVNDFLLGGPLANKNDGKWLSFQKADARVQDALLVTAQYRAKHGQYPRNMAALVPQLLPKPPTGWDGTQAMIIRHTPKGPLIYCAGEDGADDGGVYVFHPPDVIQIGKSTAPEDQVFYPHSGRHILPKGHQ